MWSIIYRTDNSAGFASFHAQSKVDGSLKRKDAALLAKLAKHYLPSLESSVLCVAQLDHFATTAKHGVFFSFPSECEAEITQYETFFSTSHLDDAKARREHAIGASPLMVLDVDSGSERTFFRLAVPGLGRKQVMKVSPVSGRRLNRTDLTIVVSKPFIGDTVTADDTRACIIDTAHASGQNAFEALCVVSGLGDPEQASSRLLEWDSINNFLQFVNRHENKPFTL